MTKNKNLLIATILAAATAVPSLAAADHDRRPTLRSTQIGEVGTHSHDDEDFVPVSTNDRFERLELRAEGRPVRLEAIDVQFVDGRKYRVEVRETLRPGQRVMVDIPAYSPVKMLVLDYANRGPFWRAREESRIEIRGITADFRDRDRRDVRYRDRDRRDVRYRDRDDRYEDPRFQWRGSAYIRIGS